MHSLNVASILLPKVEEFIKTNLSKKHCVNSWIEAYPLKVYVRLANHRIDTQKIERVLDIASIEVKPKWQKKGIGTSVIEGIHKINPLYATRIESVQSPHLERYLLKNKWKLIIDGTQLNMLDPEHFNEITGYEMKYPCANYYKLKE